MSPLVRSASLHGYEALARSLGVDVPAELRRVKLTLAQINDPDALLPYAAMIQLLEHTAEVARCNDFGRREQLLHLVNQAHTPPMSQVAAMLGYSEQAALTRSCRRWFGMSPSELRRRTSRSQ